MPVSATRAELDAGRNLIAVVRHLAALGIESVRVAQCEAKAAALLAFLFSAGPVSC